MAATKDAALCPKDAVTLVTLTRFFLKKNKVQRVSVTMTLADLRGKLLAVDANGELRQIYLNPDVRNDYQVDFGRCDVDAVVRFLCDEHAFSRDRVVAALERAFGSQRIT